MCLTIVIKQIKIYGYIFYNIYSCSRDSTKTKYLLIQVKRFIKIIKNWAEKDFHDTRD